MSLLDEIPGIGPTRRRALMRFFGSLDRLKSASVNDIAKVPGMNAKVAADLVAHLQLG
jgi:excinuclease ABC subunit C